MVLGEACTGSKNKNAAHELSPYTPSQLLAFLYSLTLKKLVGNIAFWLVRSFVHPFVLASHF